MLPDTVKVGSITYKVIEKPSIHENGDINFGLFNPEANEINVLDYIEADRAKQTFVHELVHAIFFEAGYEEQGEEMVSRIGNVLTQVLENNDFRFMNGGQ